MRICGIAAGAAFYGSRAQSDGIRHRSEQNKYAERGPVIYRAYPADEDPAVRQQQALRCDDGFYSLEGRGRHPHLRADATGRAPRARPELRRANSYFDSAEAAEGA